MWTKTTAFALGSKGVAIAAAILVAIVLWQRGTIAGQRTEIATLQGDLAMARANVATAVAINEGNAVELDRFRADSTALRAAFAGEIARLEARCRTETRIKTEIRRVQLESPATCPVAPAVGAALRGLQPDAEGGADRDQDRARDDRPAR